MALFGNAGRAGTVRQMSNDEINDRKKGTNKKWSMNGKREWNVWYVEDKN